MYAGKLLGAGHHLVLLGRGTRLTDLRTSELVLENSESGQRLELAVPVVESPDADQRYELVVVAVRAEQLTATPAILMGMNDGSDVLFFGNIAGYGPALIQALGPRTVSGFPAAGGIQDGAVIRYVLIGQQKTTLGEPSGARSSRVRRLQTMFRNAGFATTITANIDDWLLGHAAFVVPMALALYRVDTNAGRLAHGTATLRLMVRATRQAFQAAAGRWHRRDPDEPHHPLPPDAREIRSSLLAAGLGQSTRRIMVRRSQPSSGPGDDLPRRRTPGAAHRAGYEAPDLDTLLSHH